MASLEQEEGERTPNTRIARVDTHSLEGCNVGARILGDTSNGETNQKKTYLYVPPRIDDEWYQVDLPELSKNKPSTVFHQDWLGSCSSISSSCCEESQEKLGRYRFMYKDFYVFVG